MFLIDFSKGNYLGGYGDRIVGLVTIKLLSKKLNRKFYILWEKENIKEYIDYSKYDFSLIDFNENKTKIGYYNLIDKQKELKPYLMTKHINTSNKLFPYDLTVFNVNTEIAQYLYIRQEFRKDYYNDIFSIYKNLYNDILIPKKSILHMVHHILEKSKLDKIIGIQIRAGDIWLKIGPYNPIKSSSKIVEILENIKKHILLLNLSKYMIFITSDYPKIKKLSQSIFGKDNILYYDIPIIHLDRHNNKNSCHMSKIFIDNYILSQKTDILYISKMSNFGRVSALSCSHNNIYDNEELKKIDLKELLSKDEKFDDLL